MCGQSKLSTKFHRSRTGQFSYCRDCRCAYDRRYYAERGKAPRLARRRAHVERERAWMDSLKKGIPCKDCGETFPTYVMHWDHLPGQVKLDEIGSMVGSRQREVILAEIEKCELVCANCHVMRTVVRARRIIAEEVADDRLEIGA
jgi:NAD-dependent dihydropyrimidine dehydrogenase PreA subunit